MILAGPSYRRFSRYTQIRSFVQGVTATATGAIAGAVVVLGRHSIQDFWTISIALTTLIVLWKWKVPEPVIIVVSGMIGLALRS